MKNKSLSKQAFNAEYLTNKGLNIHAVIDWANIPAEIQNSIQASGVDTDSANQLILIGHLGQSLWKNVENSLSDSDNPIDNHTVEVLQGYFEKQHSENLFEIIYPGDAVIGLQQLGELAGWHFSSPFKVGINQLWGSWFAYRAVVLADTNFIETEVPDTHSPCVKCKEQYCIAACPANALDTGELDFQCCIDYRKQNASLCKHSCHARLACPVGKEYRYSDQQFHYHYAVSMKTIEEFY